MAPQPKSCMISPSADPCPLCRGLQHAGNIATSWQSRGRKELHLLCHVGPLWQTTNKKRQGSTKCPKCWEGISQFGERNNCSSHWFCWFFLPVSPRLHLRCRRHRAQLRSVCWVGKLPTFLGWTTCSFALLRFLHHSLDCFSTLSSFPTHWLVLLKNVYCPNVNEFLVL